MEIDLELRRTNPSHTALYVELLLGYTLKISQTRTWRGWELIRKLEVHSVELIYQITSDNGVSTPQNHPSLLQRAPNTSTWDFPDVIKFCVAVHTPWDKAIRFRHPDYDPNRVQKLISSSMSRHLSTCNISSKSMHAFLSNLAHRRTDKRTRACGRKHIPPPLSEVNE